MEWLDSYEIRARINPSIIIGLPLVITILTTMQEMSDSILELLGSGAAWLGLVYALSFWVRHCGKKIESKLWKEWDGAASTRFIRWRDSDFGEETKKQLHIAIERICNIKLLPKNQETENPEVADSKIIEAFSQVKAILRRDDPRGLSHKHNAEYGFNRNLLGSRLIWLLISIFGAIVCGIIWYFWKSDIVLVGFIFNILLAFCALYWGWFLLPKSTKEAADRYGESAWNSFLIISKDDAK